MPALPVGELTLTYHPSTHKSNGPSMSGKSHHVITLLTALHFLFISDTKFSPSQGWRGSRAPCTWCRKKKQLCLSCGFGYQPSLKEGIVKAGKAVMI